ncbi:MAG: hypothetical protein CMF62_03620 [Magnetococcales bacterium]|nr:hypothetical protein [Magnetococcales bacterium]|tara:strand:+ start:25535 stop:25801 length:267 start_codon:yes stop_codon:yes gene_type:complete
MDSYEAQAKREHQIIEDIGKTIDSDNTNYQSYSYFISEPFGTILDKVQQYGGLEQSKEEIYFMEQMLEKPLEDCTSREIAEASRALGN